MPRKKKRDLRAKRSAIKTTKTPIVIELYDDMRQEFVDILNTATQLSRDTGGRFVAVRIGDASVLFTRLTVICYSLHQILPHNKGYEHWDFGAVASLSRNLFECYLLFYYLCVEPISEEEVYCRKQLVNLHDCTSRIEFFTNLANCAKENSRDRKAHLKQVEGFKIQAEELRGRLLSKPFFQAIPEKRRNEFLKGKKALFLNQDEILIRIGHDIPAFRFFYHFFSLHVHSLPASFLRVWENDHGRGVKNEREQGYMTMAMAFDIGVMESAIQDMVSIFPDMQEKYRKPREPINVPNSNA